eukprot:SAG11_NODE_35502_length_266_cov_0.718563_1_plen_72_part_10
MLLTAPHQDATFLRAHSIRLIVARYITIRNPRRVPAASRRTDGRTVTAIAEEMTGCCQGTRGSESAAMACVI